MVHSVLKSCFSLLVFSSVVLTIMESEVLTSPAVTVELSIPSFLSVRFCLLYFGALLCASRQTSEVLWVRCQASAIMRVTVQQVVISLLVDGLASVCKKTHL